ncbi:hypothetical protein [Streptomyces sp. DT203]|uniref:hypothetical protein n=1 Tax=Streptomyces sp. DT203 TaxID=3393424 RepID=UPI003CE761CD
MTATPKVKSAVSPVAPSTVSPAKTTPSPQGTVELSHWQNDIEYSPACAKLDVTISNRSDVAIGSVTVFSKGENAKESEIALPPHTFSAGIPAFEEREFSLKICDERMAKNQYGPSAIPTRITWEWMRQ